MIIPFLDLKAQYQTIKPEIDDAIARVIQSQSFILGKELEEFEKEFANYLGIQYVVGVNSGTDGLILSLMSLGIGEGDEVITQPNSFIATTTAITQVGAIPVFVDCDSDTYQIDVNKIEEKINVKTKAILPVHLFGAPCEIDKIKEIARKHKLYLIEDACQAHGSAFNKKKLGTFGDLGVFSFYPGKNLGGYGDGGAVVTDSKALYEKLLSLRNYGQRKKYFSESFGLNSRLDEIQAAVLRVKLKYLDKWNSKRNIIAEKYANELKGYKIQRVIDKGISNYYIFSIEVENRENLQKCLDENNIGTLIHYPVPIHLQKVNKWLGYKVGDFSVAEKVATKILSLPMYPEISEESQNIIINCLNK